MSEQTTATITVDRDHRGAWTVERLDTEDRERCATLADALNAARRRAHDCAPAEVLVHDAYHRVVVRERIRR
ncbi:MAG TPA: DUF2188 domain-containing protein [Solirubrobacteraceae bacterium]|nr:DUF2188 domain-containing protein [Solirubrobacteraceae bacterium]